MKAYKRKNESAVSQIEKIKTTLFPEQSLQERHENFMSFYSKWGDAFLDDIVSQLNPLEKKFFIFSEE
ncbi:putative cysteine ligase BshC [compost metagenome]